MPSPPSQSIERRPPGRSTSCRSGVSDSSVERRTATAAAHAPVPQARVGPLPRSQVDISSRPGAIDATRWTLTLRGNHEWRSSPGPILRISRSRSTRDPPGGIARTRWGLPMETSESRVSPGSPTPSNPSDSSSASGRSRHHAPDSRPGITAGIRPASNRGGPMSASTSFGTPPTGLVIRSRTTPSGVSIRTSSRSTPSSVTRSRARHRNPFPQTPPSDPSAFTTVMRA